MSSVLNIILLFMVILLPLSVFAGSLEGRLAYRKGDYATAIREFESSTQRGPVGTFFLALMYLRGEGVPADNVQGLKLLRDSADEGYSAAQYLLGQRYYYGLGLPRDKALALTYLQSASEDNDYRALTFLKIIANGSRGEKKDRENIIATVKRKALSKDSNAQYTLAFMYLVGDGVPQDGAEEVHWYRAAASVNPRAAFMLSVMYQYGEGVPRDLKESFRLMRFAAEKGDPRAQYYLGTFYYQGVGTVENHQSAGEWFRKSAENGSDDAQLAYGMLLLSGDGVEIDKTQAVEWIGKAARQNNDRAKEVLRELLTYRGQSVVSPMKDPVISNYNTGKQQTENQLRLEGQSVLLDQGTFGLKFSLPTLYDAYVPQNQLNTRPIWERLQGGTFDIIIRPPK